MIQDIQDDSEHASHASEVLRPTPSNSYLLGHGPDTPVLCLSTWGGRWGCYPHLAAFPTEALCATVEAAKQVLGRNSKHS